MTGEFDIPARYAALVESYLNGGGESALHGAYKLGREALEAGVGPLVLFSIHRDVVNSLSVPAVDPDELTRQATTVFVETLAPIQMAYTGLEGARAAAAQLSTLINHQLDEINALEHQLGEAERSADGPAEFRMILGRHLAELDPVRRRLQQAQQMADVRRQMVSNIVTAQEQERRRLAREIHDDALQAMAAVMLRLGIVRRRVSDADSSQALTQLEATTRDSITRLRRLLAGLQPQELERFGLAAAIQSALEAMETDFGIACRLVNRLSSEPGLETRTIAFRVVQEALVNMRKHASASSAEVVLESSEDGVLVRVSDDGVGFDVASMWEEPERGHLGIASMRERASLAGGWLTIQSMPGRTAVELWIPGIATDGAT